MCDEDVELVDNYTEMMKDSLVVPLPLRIEQLFLTVCSKMCKDKNMKKSLGRNVLEINRPPKFAL